MSLRIVDPGLGTRVVDQGRPTARSLGVPLGGAADPISLALANAFVGNGPKTAALELVGSGAKLLALSDLGCALWGAPVSARIDRRPFCGAGAFPLRAGETLAIGYSARGWRVYLCVRGGLEGDIVLNSRSSLEPLRARSELRCETGWTRRRWVRTRFTWDREPNMLRALDGPQAGAFDLSTLYGPTFQVRPTSDRMGLRLQGASLAGSVDELTSEPVCPGTVQVTPDRQCILLGVDAQTVGGYPKAAQIIAADLHKLGQLRPGDGIRFVRISLEEAEAVSRDQNRELQQWLTRLQVTDESTPETVWR